MTRRVVRSTRVPTAEPLRAPLMRSPSQWPGTVRVRHVGGALGNRRHIGDLAASIDPSRPRPTRLARLTQRRQQFAPQGAAGQHIQARIDGLGRELFPHVVRIRASEAPGNLFGRAALEPAVSGHTATARDPGVCAVAVADGLGRSPGCVPCRPDRVGPASCCGPTRGSRCWGLAPTPWPSSAANGRGPGPGSRSHVLRHSCVYRISLAWQHRSPSGLAVLHLELELKLCFSTSLACPSKRF